MNDRRRKGLEKEISRIVGMTLLTEIKNEKIKNLVSIHKVELTKDGRYLDLTFSVLDLKNNINKEKVYYVPNGIIYATLYGKDKNGSYEYLTKDEWKWF